ALGGMLFGTLFGVLIIPGLYYVFAMLSDGKKLIDDEEQHSLSEDLVTGENRDKLNKRVKKIIERILRRNNKGAE
ncbi:MAG TPA: hypothetical protein PLS16_10170, partial [Chitinophagales bacterium]|nr:hypothetical protein [Chitinophagales bacterium]